MNKIKIRRIPFAAALFLSAALFMSACGVTRVYVSPDRPTSIGNYTVEDPAAAEKDSGEAATARTAATAAGSSEAEVFFSASETRAMSNAMLANIFVHDGKILYGSKHDENGIPYLCRMKYSALSGGMVVKETEILETGVSARYLILHDGVLYYIRENAETGDMSVVGLRVDGTDEAETERATAPSAETAGDAPVTLYSGPCDYLFLHGDTLYFTDTGNHLLSLNIGADSGAESGTGGEPAQIIGDKEVFIPYMISDNLLLYQDDADGESLHLRDISKGTDRRITEGRVYDYILSGFYLYYTRVEENNGEKARLYRTDIRDILSGKETAPEQAEGYMGPRFAVNGDHLIGSNWSTVPLSSWNTLADNSCEQGILSACQYVSESFEIFYNYNSDGLIEKAVLYEPTEKRTSYFEMR